MKENIEYSLIWKSLDGQLNEHEQQKLNAWLDSNEEHLIYYNQLQANRKKTELLKFSAEQRSQAWKNMNISKKRKPRFSLALRIAASAACVVLTVGIWFAVQNRNEGLFADGISIDPGMKKATLVLDNGEMMELQSGNDTLLMTNGVVIENIDSKLHYKYSSLVAGRNKYNKLMVPRGAEYNLQLSDGTKVWVNSATIIRYPVVFAKNERRVEIIGEAFFDVKTDSLRPFIVNSGKHQVVVYGTEFNVKAYPEESIITTTLVEGKVKVQSSGKEELGEFLTPEFQSVFHKKDQSFFTQKVNTKKFTSWKDGRFYFREMPLEEMLRILGWWYNVEFRIKKDELKEVKFSGNIEKKKNIQEILNKLMKTNEITFKANNEMIFVE
ncbi:FecR family protein [Puteibacter caeruleilacunae]|nr:FecR family protein [Puteibacter caeruleilacunae]